MRGFAGSGFFITPVGRKRPQAFGLFDMHGKSSVVYGHRGLLRGDNRQWIRRTCAGPTRDSAGGSFVIADLTMPIGVPVAFLAGSRGS